MKGYSMKNLKTKIEALLLVIVPALGWRYP